jgi:hypothetical protein
MCGSIIQNDDNFEFIINYSYWLPTKDIFKMNVESVLDTSMC